MADLSNVSTSDLEAYQSGNLSAVSTEGLEAIQSALTPSTYLSRIGDKLSDRGEAIMEPTQAYASGQQGLLRSANQALLNGIGGGINDVIGETISTITPDFVKDLGSSALQAFGQLPSISGNTLGQDISNEAGRGLAAYGQFAEQNPALARDVSAAGNALGLATSFVPAAKAAPAVATAISGVDDTARALSALRPNIPSVSMTPSIDQVKLPVLDLAKKHNIQVGLSDLTDNETYKRLISQGEALPFSGGSRNSDAQQKSFNRAVSRTFTNEADALTPEVMESARKKLGTDFQKFTKDKDFEITPDYLTRIESLTNDVSRNVYGRDAADTFKTYVKDVEDAAGPEGIIKGDRLDALRRQFSKIARTSTDEGTAKLASDFEDGIIDLITAGDDDIAKEITDAKYRYKNYKTVQGLTIKDQVSGNVSPTQLTQKVVNSFGADAVSTGRAGDLGEIARVGQTMRKLNDSGTAKNQVFQQILNGNLGAAIPVSLLNPAAGAAQAAATGAAWLGNRALQNKDIAPKTLEDALRRVTAQQIKEIESR